MNANIEKTNDTQLTKAPLSKKERFALSAKLTGWGKLGSAVTKTGLNEGTLKRAAAGMDVKPETAEKIREFLSL
jgi:hypothetical protein